MLNKNLNRHLKNHKNKDKQKPYGPTNTYRKFVTIIKVGRVPYVTVTEATRVYNRKYATITEGTHVCCQKISKRKTTDIKVLNMEYWKLKIKSKQITHRIRHSNIGKEAKRKDPQ